ncbi:AMP-binding protein [Flavicella sediminum]|uniref:AMP-binding protein n=1 Tax=Flavicella sediminum TaxID=2585141 RepID=UPI00111FC6B7|nr:AMP-binding protein [Flavicella sediminum]
MKLKKLEFNRSFKLNKSSFENVKDLLLFSKDLSTDIADFLVDWFDNKLYVEVKTSGSTGIPKRIQVQKKHMVNSAVATGTYFDLGAGTKALLCLSANYIAGKMMLVRALELGWELSYTKENSCPLKDPKSHFDFAALVPLQVANSINDLNKVKKILVGGGVVSESLKKQLIDTSCRLYASYGMTETVSHIALKKLNNFLPDENQECYRALPNVSFSIDARNCLKIDAPLVSNNCIITNDVISLYSKKEFVWLGRFDSIINSGGLKFIPEQIEKKMASHIEERFFIYGCPDARLGEKLVLFIEGEGSIIYDKSEIALFLKQVDLDKFEIPKAICFVPSFAETATKKIQRKNTVALTEYA